MKWGLPDQTTFTIQERTEEEMEEDEEEEEKKKGEEVKENEDKEAGTWFFTPDFDWQNTWDKWLYANISGRIA